MTRLPTLGPRGEGWVIAQIGLLVAVAATGLLGPAWDGLLRTATTVIGVAIGLGGSILAARGLADLRHDLTALPRPRDGARLVDTGAYRYVRHPIYGGLILVAMAWGLILASPVSLLLSIALFGFFDLKSRREEAWLEERFPSYPGYRARTRRLLPGLY